MSRSARLILTSLIVLPLLLDSSAQSEQPAMSKRPRPSESSIPITKDSNSLKSVDMAERERSIRISSQAMTDEQRDVKVVFSDVDGTLVHYKAAVAVHSEASLDETGNSLLHLPPSATGTQGVISARTLRLCREIRRRGVKLVLVSGMRTSTLVQRLPYLPKADAYCSEGGSRIFYPSKQGLEVVPVSFDGATDQDLETFSIIEDPEWRRRIVRAVGLDGFIGNDLTDLDTAEKRPSIPVESRSGPLWELANRMRKKGFVLDLKGYAACFRVNRKQQTSLSVSFDDLLSEDFAVPSELASSTNLGCVDFYPALCGKKNCCRYLAQNFIGSSDLLSIHCVCLCDDDNDLEMALACSRAFIPSVSSESMATAIQDNPEHFTTTFTSDVIEGPASTEAALESVLSLIESREDR